MAVSFSLKVINPVALNPGLAYNVNWSLAPYESEPDVMPGATTPVAFRAMPEAPGQFLLWASSLGALAQDNHGYTSPTFTPQEGAVYVWNMAANTVAPEGAAGPATSTTVWIPPSFQPEAIISWAKANKFPAIVWGIGLYSILGGKRRRLF